MHSPTPVVPVLPAERARGAEAAFVRGNEVVVVLMGAVMVVLVVANVFCRYVLGFSVTWAEEFSQYLMVWIAFLGGGLALRQGRHVAVEMLQDLLPGAPGACCAPASCSPMFGSS